MHAYAYGLVDFLLYHQVTTNQVIHKKFNTKTNKKSRVYLFKISIQLNVAFMSFFHVQIGGNFNESEVHKHEQGQS